MAHNVRIYADSVYVSGVAPLAAYFNALDAAQAAAIGETGGTWAPASGLAVSGAGMWFCGLTSLSGTASATVTQALPLLHGDSDYILLGAGHTGATRQLIASGDLALDISSGQALMQPDPTTDGVINVAAGAYRSGGRTLFPLRVHNASLMTTVTFYFVIGSHAGAWPPATFPQFRVYRVDASGNVTSMYTGASSVGAGYVVLPTPANHTAYEATTNFVYSIDSSLVEVIDTGRYTYFAEVIDESGPGPNAQNGNTWVSAVSSCSAIPDMGPQ